MVVLDPRIGLQKQSGTVRYRNIEIRELPPRPFGRQSAAAEKVIKGWDEPVAGLRVGGKGTSDSPCWETRHP